MKTLYLFLSFVVCSAIMIAQPSLQYPQNAPAIGDIMEIQFIDPVGLTAGSSGPDVTWDYSQLTNIWEEGFIKAIEPSAAPAGGSFPEANIAMNMNDTIFTYSEVDNTGLYYLGSQVIAGMIPVLFIYSDYRTYLQYPFTYNDAFSDTYKGVSSVMLTEVRLTATSNVLADAYGTLKLPTGTFNNVLRVKTLDTEIDSIFVKGSFISTSTLNRTQYHWFAPNSNGPLFSLEFVDRSGDYDTCCFYTTIVVGISEPGKQDLTRLSVFPNPANDHVMVEFEISPKERASILIVNQVGQVVISRTVNAKSMGSINENINISTLPPGIYFANINCDCGKQLTEKFVIR